jgi:hypothetical protein
VLCVLRSISVLHRCRVFVTAAAAADSYGFMQKHGAWMLRDRGSAVDSQELDHPSRAART